MDGLTILFISFNEFNLRIVPEGTSAILNDFV